MSKKIHVRPGKKQSKIGFAAGLLFCMIGIFIVIPIFGFFGIIWTILAGLITYTHYKNGFTDDPIQNQVIEIEEDVQMETSGKARVEERLRTLQDLYDQRLIKEEEYNKKRQEILNDL